MSDAAPARLNACGCCESESPPPSHENRPGLTSLNYRIGTHATFLARMLARITQQSVPPDNADGPRPLSPLSTRATDDPAIALLDAWAVTADVLAFYQQRAVTEEDYAAVTQRHPDVQRAVATRRWTGSWNTMYITVDRRGGRVVDADFEDELREFLERFRLAGQDLEIDGPTFVPLDLELRVCVMAGYLRSEVKAALLEKFSARHLPDGGRGFFHPDNLTFGQPVYLSAIIAAAMEVQGVHWVEVARFQRWSELPQGEIDAGQMSLARLEIARLDNDPNAPENGKLEFEMEGGA